MPLQERMGSRVEEEEVSVTRSIKLPVTLDIALRNIKDAKVIRIFAILYGQEEVTNFI